MLAIRFFTGRAGLPPIVLQQPALGAGRLAPRPTGVLYRYVAYDKTGVARLFQQHEDSAKAYCDLLELIKQFYKIWPQSGAPTKWVIRLEHPE